jgi:ApaG protein
MYTKVTKSIKVSVIPAHVEESSDPPAGVYGFSYTITIENTGRETVQLLERHWIIVSGGVQIAEIVGPGVVGEQPVLSAGESYEYTSGAVIQDPIGSMEGTYKFKNQAGQFFEVQIPKFDLVYPVNLH